MELLDSLSSNQKEILSSFQAVTSTDDIENAINILNSSDWNLEMAITRLYDGDNGNDGGREEPDEQDEGEGERRPLIHSFGIDESQVTSSTSRNNNGTIRGGSRSVADVGINYWLMKVLTLPLNLLSYPASILYSATSLLFTFIARIFNLRTTFIRPRNPFSSSAREKRLDPTASSERWVRNLEELTGAVRWSRRNDSTYSTSATGGAESSSVQASGSGIGGSGLNRRNSGVGRKVLPNFFIGSYEDALKRAKEDIRILMVILTCEEHENDVEFKNSTLVDPELVRILSSQDIVVWGGDIRDRDCYQASRTLQYLSLPFVAFVCLQPVPLSPLNPTASSSASKMTIISRLEGSPSSSTSASTILTQLNTIVIPRVTPFLTRLRTQEAARQSERFIRAEQDRAYLAAAEKDTERVLAKRAEEFNRIKEKEKNEKKEKDLDRLKRLSKRWRENKRCLLKSSEPAEGEKEGTVRLGIRLGDGRRAVRKFRGSDSLEDIYAFVECSLEKSEEDEFEKKLESRGSSLLSNPPPPPNKYTQIYEFRLAATFPRLVLEIDGSQGSRKISEVGNGVLMSGGNLVVEGLEKRRESMGENAVSDEEEEED